MKAIYYRAYLLEELISTNVVYPDLAWRLEGRQSEFNTQMSNNLMKKADRMKIINDYLCDKSISESEPMSHTFWAIVKKNLNGYYSEITIDNERLSWKEERAYKCVFGAICESIKRTEFVTRDAVTILRKITWRIRQFDEWLISERDPRGMSSTQTYSEWGINADQRTTNLWRRLPQATKEALTASWNKVIAIINEKLSAIPSFYRITDTGEWRNCDSPEWIKLSYNGHRSAVVQPIVKQVGKMKYGFELEGAMSYEDFQNCMTELSKTPYEGGYLLDKRNLVMATLDASLPSGTGVEWVFAPFEYKEGTKYWKAVEDILAKHHFKRTVISQEWGVHCHLDANKFENINTVEKFHNKVYDMSDTEKILMYKRPSNRFCAWRKDGNVLYEDKWTALEGQFTKDHKQLGYLDRKFVLQRDQYHRYYLVNYQHLKFKSQNFDEISSGTVEIRGFYAEKKLTEAAKDIKEKILTGIVKGEYL